MYYHVMLEIENKKIYELDKKNLYEIEKDVVTPFLMNSEFQFSGYFIAPSKVIRLLITKSERNSKELYDIETNKMLGDNTFYPLKQGEVVTEFEEHCVNITKDVMKSVEESLENSHIKSLKKENKQKILESKTIFLAYSYKQEDEEFISGFKDLLEDKGWHIIDGKADQFGSVSDAILKKIEVVDYFMVIMTKRDEKENGLFKTSSWLIEEKGAALAFNKKVILIIEDGVDDSDIGGLHGDIQRFRFTRNNFLHIAMNIIRILSKEDEKIVKPDK